MIYTGAPFGPVGGAAAPSPPPKTPFAPPPQDTKKMKKWVKFKIKWKKIQKLLSYQIVKSGKICKTLGQWSCPQGALGGNL